MLLLVKVGVAYVEAGSEVSSSESIKNDQIEAPAKSEVFVGSAYGHQRGTITLNGVYVPSDAGLSALENAALDQDEIILRESADGVEVREVTCKIESMDKNKDDNVAVTYTCALRMQGVWTTV